MQNTLFLYIQFYILMSRLFKSIKVILIKGSIKRFLVLMRQHFYVTTVNTVFVINIKWTLLSGFHYGHRKRTRDSCVHEIASFATIVIYNVFLKGVIYNMRLYCARHTRTISCRLSLRRVCQHVMR